MLIIVKNTEIESTIPFLKMKEIVNNKMHWYISSGMKISAGKCLVLVKFKRMRSQCELHQLLETPRRMVDCGVKF